MKKNRFSKNWLKKQNRDFYFRKSKFYGYRSRSAFKLIEMNNKFKFLRKSSSLIDLGSSPGGWSQVASKIVIKGKILAVDIIPMEKIANCKTIGISSGASAPEILVNNFIDEIRKKFIVKIEEVEIVKENINFKVPGKLN